MDAVSTPPPPRNEPVLAYPPGSPERDSLQACLRSMAAEQPDVQMTIGGALRPARGEHMSIVAPHNRRRVLATAAQATSEDVAVAVQAALAAAPAWRDLTFDDRAAVLLRAAEMLAGPWRDRLNAATMLGQSKSVQQAEIDSACELIDFLRFNVHFARGILAEQPQSAPGIWNRTDHRPLEGFVLAITPFNFTSIAANLALAPALMGCTVVWKPSPTQTLAAAHTMRLLEAAGLPDGVINLVTGDGAAVSEVALTDPRLGGVHFTGSTATFRRLWQTVAGNLDRYCSYPRLVGETGGKDFILAHSSATVPELAVGLVRGAYEYQGQKCSAASRAYLPRSLWDNGLRDALVDLTRSVRYGDVTDFAMFGGAVIDARAFGRLRDVLEKAPSEPSVSVLAGGGCDDSDGWFVEPTVLLGEDPAHEMFSTEYFGPILAVHVYDDRSPGSWDGVLDLVDRTSPYALTGAVFGTDRVVLSRATERLRFAAGNFYLNDKPTGAVVGQQPFGGARASGTDDKAGSAANLMRWTAPRTIKETLVPPVDHSYPHMA